MSTPDISLPALHSSKKEWTEINRILCVDQSLNDSGAALFVEGRYIPVMNTDGCNVGLALTLSQNWTQQKRCVAYGRWISFLIDQHDVDLVIGESHPFARGKQNSSIATVEALAGIRWITMYVCGQKDITYSEFSTSHVKTIMCGSSTASKEAVQMILTASGIALPRYQKKPDIINSNVCDAIAMGEVICRMQRQEILLKKYQPIVGSGRSQSKSRAKS
jgi:Holliday junction resolvasome RuvABC endonuclease subunit